MLEESISCSPGCETNRSQSRRLHSRFKRKHRRPDNPTSPTDVSYLKGLYEESDHALNATQYEHFNPFQNEILLAAVDMVRVPKSPSTFKEIPSVGFVKLEDLPIKDNEFQEHIEELVTLSPPNPTSSELHAQYGPETQFGITESEFVRFCDDVEMDVKEPNCNPSETPQKKTIMEDFCSSTPSQSSPKFEAEEEVNEYTTSDASKTPQTKKSVVDAILEDFCASPYNESPPKTLPENATPIFRFRSICIRTYTGTRRPRLRRNIDTEFANAQLTDDDGSVSDSSGLSMQEDLTQSIVPQLDTVDLNSSIKVCENLLQLSSYFSQTTSHDKTPQSSEEHKSKPLSEVVEEIIQLKRKSYEVTRRKSSDEFYGFSDGDSIEEFHGFSDEEDKSHEHTLKELLDAEDDVLQHINCDSLCYEKVQPKIPFSYVSELEFGVDRVRSVIDDAEKFLQSIDGQLDAGESDQNPTICDSPKSLPTKSCPDSLVKEEALFEDVDLWNDDDCLLNYVTQKPNLKPETRRVEKDVPERDIQADSAVQVDSFGFSTASKKPIVISEEGKRKASEFWSKFEQSEKEREAVENEGNQNSACHEKVAIEGYASASRKSLLEVVPSDKPSSTRSISKAHTSRQIPRISSNPNKNQRRTNELSDEVKQKAEELLKDIEFFEDGFEEEQKAEQFIACIEAPSSKPQFEGLKTASKKTISVSDEAKRRADLFIKDVKAEGMPKDFLESLQADMKHDTAKALTEDKPKDVMTFEGFKTASKKPIQISDAAKRRAEQISKDVQAADLPREFLECIQADLKDGVSSSRSGKEQAPTEVKFEGFKTASKKLIQISDAAKRRAEQISKEAADLPREFLECIQADLKDEDSLTRASKEKVPTEVKFEGFKTASKKQIQISNVAKQRAEQMLKEIKSAALPQDFLKCVEADLDDNPSSVAAAHGEPSVLKPTPISDASKQPVEELISVIEPRVHLPPDVVERFQSNPHVDGTPKRNRSCMDADNMASHHRPRSHEAPSNVLSPQKINERDSRKPVKRKADILPAEESLISPKRRFSCNDRAPLNDIENAPLHKTTSHPDIKSTQKVAKKNLLSLSKRKKCNSSKQTADTSAAAKTPEKSDSSLLRCNANTTPNLKEFFDCVATSTPRLMRTNSNKVDSNHKDSSIDADFRKINWENANNSGRVCKTNTLTDLNITCIEVSPSPKQRIERLKMYAEPPPISPILMVNKCRPSGLRRGRSLMKP